MIYLQHKLVEEAIRRRQVAMHAADQHAAYDPERLKVLEDEAYTAIAIAALRCLRDDGDWKFTTELLEQLVSEVAGARDAVENERALRRLL